MHERVIRIDKKSHEKRINLIPKGMKASFSQSMISAADHILYLQRTIGNQAVQRLYKSGYFQTKLKIGQPNDKYEQEADRVADEVMRMPEPQINRQPLEEDEEKNFQIKSLAEQITPLVQRQVEEEEEEENIQAKEAPGNTSVVTPQIAANINALRGGGQPLPESTRQFFEPRFGVDLSKVRVHSSGQAAETAKGINARAYTIDQNIAFGSDQYKPKTLEGKRLLAHELTHVVQQGNKMQLTRFIQRKHKYNRFGEGKSRSLKIKKVEETLTIAQKIARPAAQTFANWVAKVNREMRSDFDDWRGKLFLNLFGTRSMRYAEKVRDVISDVGNILFFPIRFRGASSSECGTWDAYVKGNKFPVNLCPKFFSVTDPERARILIHEMVHLAGISEPEGESYDIYYTCEPAKDSWENAGKKADRYAHFIYCLRSGGTSMEEGRKVTGRKRPKGSK